MTPTQPQQQQTIFLPIATIAGYAFNVNSLISCDLTNYEVGKGGRSIKIYLVGPWTHDFLDERADKFHYWYLQVTGQLQVEPAVRSSGVT